VAAEEADGSDGMRAGRGGSRQSRQRWKQAKVRDQVEVRKQAEREQAEQGACRGVNCKEPGR
jgi:hypothetical protein